MHAAYAIFLDLFVKLAISLLLSQLTVYIAIAFYLSS